MSKTLSTLSNLLKGIKLSCFYQIAAGGKQFYVAGLNSIDHSNTIPPTIIVWNMTDDTSNVFCQEGTKGEFGVYPIVQLTNGNIVVSAGKTYTGYCFEINLLNLSLISYHAIPAVGPYTYSGPGNYYAMGSGTVAGAQYISWCDFGGGNWVDHLITNFANGKYVRGTYVQAAGDGHTYAYAHEYDSNKVIAVRIDTGAESVISGLTGYAKTSLCLVTLDGGTTRTVYLKADEDWFIVDGLTLTPTTTPTGAQQEWNYEELFKSDVYPVDLTDLMPTPAGESTLKYTRGGTEYTSTATGAAPDTVMVNLFSAPWGDNKCRIAGGWSYGPIYEFDPDTDEATFLGYTPDRNPYELVWLPNLGLGCISGYDKLLALYDVNTNWSWKLGVDEFSDLINPYMVSRSGQSTSYDRFLYSVVNAVDKKVYHSSNGGDELLWYDHVSETWSKLSLKTSCGLYDSDIMHIKSIRGGHFIAISSRDQDIGGGDWVGRLRLFHVLSQTITKVFTVGTAQASYVGADIGIMVEVGTSLTDNGHVIAVRGNLSTGCKAWRINTHAIMPSAVVWEIDITGNAFNTATTGTKDGCDLEIGPDGLIYLMVGTALKTLNPSTGELLTITVNGGSIPAASRLRWVGASLYAYGALLDANIYKLV